MTLQALINSISLSELKNIQFLHLRAAFQHITSLFVCDVCIHCHCPTTGWKTSVQKPKGLKKEISCHKTILLSHKCGTQSKLFLNSHLEQVFNWSGNHFIFFLFFFSLSRNHPLLFSCVGWVVIHCSQAELKVFWEPPEALETTVVNVFNLTCLCVWELTLDSLLLWCLG